MMMMLMVLRWWWWWWLRSAKGMAHQDMSAEWGQAKQLLPLSGWDLLGLPLKAPNATYERVYTLPLLTISMGKGTGVVTSVPRYHAHGPTRAAGGGGAGTGGLTD